ncbi:MAG: mevalonate kinase [Anaerolineales bacterium]|nr:mevalonate kinase [Anaerolineales bacterium]
MTTSSSPGKIILFGEHAVVYGQPAIAVPVTQVNATCTIERAGHQGVILSAPDFGQRFWFSETDRHNPLAAAVYAFQDRLENHLLLHNLTITVTSTIPVASGLGSGAAIAACIIRALAQHLGRADLATDMAVSAMTYEVERIHHGTPSGIDNTVVSYERPVYFVRDLAVSDSATYQRALDVGLALYPPALETFHAHTPLHILIANTGISAPTKESVGDVRRQWLETPAPFNQLFAACGDIAQEARTAIEQGQSGRLGELMWANHEHLRQMTVSSAELDTLVEAAKQAGALGAKLSGGGRGGNMIALVQPETETAVREALLAAGAISVIKTTLTST